MWGRWGLPPGRSVRRRKPVAQWTRHLEHMASRFLAAVVGAEPPAYQPVEAASHAADFSVSTARPKVNCKHQVGRRPKRLSKQSSTNSVLIRGVMSFGEKRPKRDRTGPKAAKGSQELGAKVPPLLGI
jgi:hypothetical protein